MKRPRLVSLLLLVFGCLPPATALADGKAWARHTDLASFSPVAENEQCAAIRHENGREEMAIAIGLDLAQDDGALWVFPVPGAPGDVQLKVRGGFPDFRGRDSRQPGRDAVNDLMAFARLTQVYPALWDMTSLGGAFESATTHMEVEKWGVHAETVTADSAGALAEHLSGEGPSVAEDELQAFGPYLQDGWTMVVTWVRSRAELAEEFPDFAAGGATLEERRPCLSVSFPTDRPFYPMRPTSSYGDALIPLRLWVAGHVKVETEGPLEAPLGAGYYTQHARSSPGSTFNGVTNYTVFTGRAPARAFTEDLWFVPHEPFGVRYARFLHRVRSSSAAVPILIATVLLLSCMATAVSGRWGYGAWRPYVWLGIANLMTIAGLFVASARLRDRDGSRPRNWSTFFVVSSVLFVILTLVAGALLKLPLYL